MDLQSQNRNGVEVRLVAAPLLAKQPLTTAHLLDYRSCRVYEFGTSRTMSP